MFHGAFVVALSLRSIIVTPPEVWESVTVSNGLVVSPYLIQSVF